MLESSDWLLGEDDDVRLATVEELLDDWELNPATVEELESDDAEEVVTDWNVELEDELFDDGDDELVRLATVLELEVELELVRDTNVEDDELEED